MEKNIEKCNLCPRKCNINRYSAQGFCKAKDKVKVAHIGLHNFEEPCISHKNGSGTIFFSGCNLKCVFCQNYKISDSEYGILLSDEELAAQMIKLQNMGADNINLVSPTIYVLNIVNAVKIAKNMGLSIPVIYNTNGYDDIESLKLLENVVDIYLPDYKYAFSALSEKYSLAKDYPIVALKAIKECLRQKPKNVYSDDGKLKSGTVIRHLVLPNHIINTKKVLRNIKENFGTDVTISVMFQYFPTYKAMKIEKLNRKITKREYKEVKEYIEKLGFASGYIQDLEENELKYVPDFNVDTLK